MGTSMWGGVLEGIYIDAHWMAIMGAVRPQSHEEPFCSGEL